MQCEDGAAPNGTMGIGVSGTTESTTCAAGQVAVGIAGKEGNFIDELSVRCRAADLSGATTTAASYGGTSGSPDGPYDCPAGQLLSGVDGTVVPGGFVRDVVIICELLDTDEDGAPDATDNCDAIANADQADGDGDGIGDRMRPGAGNDGRLGGPSQPAGRLDDVPHGQGRHRHHRQGRQRRRDGNRGMRGRRRGERDDGHQQPGNAVDALRGG